MTALAGTRTNSLSRRLTVRLKNCAFFAHHGMFDEEKRLGQRFFVDVELGVSHSDAPLSDSIHDTVNYASVYEIVETSILGSRRNLIETLSQEIARSLLDRFELAHAVTVNIRKPGASVPGVLDFAEVEYAETR